MRDKQAHSKKGPLIKLEDEDDDSDDAPRGGRDKGKPDGNKEKSRVKSLAEATTLRDQIGDMTKMKETMLTKHWDAQVAMAEKKDKHKEKWERRCAFEARKITLEEQKRRDERTVEEDRFMMMNPRGGMDAMTKKVGN